MTKTYSKVFGVFIALLIGCALMLPATALGATHCTESKAASLAKAKVGKSAHVTEIDHDYKAGKYVYEVDLVKGFKEYTLTYRQSDSKLIEYEWELISKYGQKKTGADLSKASIKKRAKSKTSGATVKSIVKKRDDGLTEYKVTLKKGSKLYTLTYNAKSGHLLDYKWKITSSSATSTNYIGMTKAKQIALNKVPGATIYKAEFDRNDGVPVYEIEMYKDGWEYELTIHAKTGKILEYDREHSHR